ncbi:MAG: DUF2807 domain-containing protein [Anaerolineales bacterium]|nr:DUF2807 domain-containing protein [Anaerolineales bacterium]
MYKHIYLIIAIILGILSLAACGMNIIRGSGVLATETRPVSGFDRLSLSGMGEIILTQGDEEALEIEAEDNLIPYIKTEVRQDTLYISYDNINHPIISPTRPIRFYLSVKELSGIKISGSGTVEAQSLSTDELELAISGSGEASIAQLTASALAVKISGSGKIEIGGQVGEQSLSISGSGKCNNVSLESQDTTITVTGSGKAEVWASETLDVRISGSGEVRYSGTPQVSQTISGSGRVHGQN